MNGGFQYETLIEEDDDYDENFLISSESDESDNDDLEYVRDWCQVNENSPVPPRFPFIGNPGIKVPVPSDLVPVKFFELFLTSDIINLIVMETNRYAENDIKKGELTPKSRANKWEPTNTEQIKVFIGLLLYQGIIKKPEEKLFWSTRPILSTPFVNETMPFNVYTLLMRYLHFSSTETEEPSNKLQKISSVFEMFVDNFKTVYIPERDISIDESLMPYQDKLGWKQFIPLKRARFGIKTLQLRESISGYIWNSIIYTGKSTVFEGMESKLSMGTKTVMSLTKPLLGLGYCLTTSNFYTCPELAEFLLKNRTDVYGTMRLSRKNIPPQLKSAKLKKGETIAFKKGKMCMVKWQDKKPVCLLSTIHGAQVKDIAKRDKIIRKPLAVIDYNQTMGGVDKADQCMSYYPWIRKQQRKYYKKIFRHLLDQALWNSFIIYKKCGGSIGLLEFRISVVESLVLKNKKVTSDEKETPLKDRLLGRHFPRYVPAKGKKSKPTRRCVVCCSKFKDNGKRIRKESRYECGICDVGLCHIPCFEIYHTEKDF